MLQIFIFPGQQRKLLMKLFVEHGELRSIAIEATAMSIPAKLPAIASIDQVRRIDAVKALDRCCIQHSENPLAKAQSNSELVFDEAENVPDGIEILQRYIQRIHAKTGLLLDEHDQIDHAERIQQA